MQQRKEGEEGKNQGEEEVEKETETRIRKPTPLGHTLYIAAKYAFLHLGNYSDYAVTFLFLGDLCFPLMIISLVVFSLHIGKMKQCLSTERHLSSLCGMKCSMLLEQVTEFIFESFVIRVPALNLLFSHFSERKRFPAWSPVSRSMNVLTQMLFLNHIDLFFSSFLTSLLFCPVSPPCLAALLGPRVTGFWRGHVVLSVKVGFCIGV